MSLIKLADSVSLYCITDIHEHALQFEEMIEKIKPDSSKQIAFCGDAIHKGYGYESFVKITKILKSYVDKNQAYIIRGNHELKEIKANRKKGLDEYLSWWDRQPLCHSFSWNNGHRLTMIHGGVSKHHREENLYNDPQVCYIRNLDEEGNMIPLIWQKMEGKSVLMQKKPGKSWHEFYNGRFGYIVSGHAAQKDGIPKFYNYSCNIDTACYETGILTCLPYSNQGKGEYFQVKGESFKPDIGEIIGAEGS